MDPPDSLKDRIDLFKAYGAVFRRDDELFSEVSWTAVFEGQNIHPERPHPLTFGTPLDRIDEVLSQTRDIIARGAEAMPSHADFLKRACGAVLGPGDPPAETAEQILSIR
jgi:tryptophan halogenase